MKNLGEELQKELGPGSEFQKNILSKAKEMEKKFGPGSDFEQRMKRFGERMAAKYGEGSEFAEKLKKAKKDAKAAKISSDTPRRVDRRKRPRPRRGKRPKTRPRKLRDLKALRAQIDELSAQLKKLEEGDRNEDE